jgi:hypothetical protein
VVHFVQNDRSLLPAHHKAADFALKLESSDVDQQPADYNAVQTMLLLIQDCLGKVFTFAELQMFVEAKRGVPLMIEEMPPSVPAEITGLCVALETADLVLYRGASSITQQVSQLHELAHLLFEDMPRHRRLARSVPEVLSLLKHDTSKALRYRVALHDDAELRAELLATHLVQIIRAASHTRASRWVG